MSAGPPILPSCSCTTGETMPNSSNVAVSVTVVVTDERSLRCKDAILARHRTGDSPGLAARTRRHRRTTFSSPVDAPTRRPPSSVSADEPSLPGSVTGTSDEVFTAATRRGRSTGAHRHYQVRHRDGREADPMAWLNARGLQVVPGIRS